MQHSSWRVFRRIRRYRSTKSEEASERVKVSAAVSPAFRALSESLSVMASGRCINREGE